MTEMRTDKESFPVLLTPREVASTLRVDLSTVYRWIDRGMLGAVQFGGARHTVRIPAAELVRLSASPKTTPGGGWGVLEEIEMPTCNRPVPSD